MVAALSVSATHVAAQTPSAESNRRAYDISVTCFVANVVAEGSWKDRGETERARRYGATAEIAFNAAVRMGQVLGLTGVRVQADLDQAVDSQMAPMMRDQAYFDRVVGQCRSVGLMATA